MPETTNTEQAWSSLRSSDFKAQTETSICASKEQAFKGLITSNITLIGLLLHRCGEKGESVCKLESECKKLASKEYKRQHDIVTRSIHWKLCELHQP